MYIYLDIVQGFSCEMCGTCCRRDWSVTVDKESFLRNRDYFGASGRTEEFGQAFVRLETNRALGEYAYIKKQDDGGCCFLGKDNLCRLHREAGHQHLDSVCQTFPRYPMDSERAVEVTLSFSCPAVLKKIERWEPLEVIRSESLPIVVNSDSYVVSVYPSQQQGFTPLRYYFELEHHFIDIIQCRGLDLEERISLVTSTVDVIEKISHDERFGELLRKTINDNYDFMDQAVAKDISLADVLVEHFFVNFIFKKPFYIYGLRSGAKIMLEMWQTIKSCRQGVTEPMEERTKIFAAVMGLELKYSHNRQSVSSWLARSN
ncbi:MAG: hypothetical protein H6Q73_758 [Firmicutes bacterium]|nr:hypothetical protein [Bacillota bacterium]